MTSQNSTAQSQPPQFATRTPLFAGSAAMAIGAATVYTQTVNQAATIRTQVVLSVAANPTVADQVHRELDPVVGALDSLANTALGVLIIGTAFLLLLALEPVIPKIRWRRVGQAALAIASLATAALVVLSGQWLAALLIASLASNLFVLGTTRRDRLAALRRAVTAQGQDSEL